MHGDEGEVTVKIWEGESGGQGRGDVWRGGGGGG